MKRNALLDYKCLPHASNDEFGLAATIIDFDIIEFERIDFA